MRIIRPIPEKGAVVTYKVHGRRSVETGTVRCVKGDAVDVAGQVYRTVHMDDLRTIRNPREAT